MSLTSHEFLHVFVLFLEEVLNRGDVWFAPMEEIAAHVPKVTADGTYTPRRYNLPYYDAPISPMPV